MILDFGVILRVEHLPNFSLLMRNVSKYYRKFYSVTMMWSELALPRFEEIVEKFRCDLREQMSCSNNGLVSLFSRLFVW